ncbi:CD1375 family protein [Enterococcus asini]|nr:CD1375 family protein [Enterococcus asini]
MVKVYANLIKKGAKSIEDVPEEIRKEVQAILAAESAD